MPRKKNHPKIILLGGILVFCWGLKGIIVDALSSNHQYPPDFGVVLGFSADAIIGVFIILIATSLIKIEKRLDEIEQNRQERK